jgi:choline dehydrogenase-like flavoprotein
LISQCTSIVHHVDVCIVGSGPCGSTLARALDGSSLSVVVLEGSQPTFDKLASDEHDYYGLESSADQALYAGHAEGMLSEIDPLFLTRSRLRMLGGTMLRWGGWCRELDRVDFEPRAPWSNIGWRIPYAEMQRYYSRAWQVLTGSSLSTAGTRDAPPALRAGVFKIIDRPYMVFQNRFRSTLAGSLNVVVMTGAHAIALQARRESPNSIDYLTYVSRDESGRWDEHRIFAREFIFAMGGLETTRFLLSCRSRGLPIASPMLGKNFTLHPVIPIVGRVHALDGVTAEFRQTFLNRTTIGRVGPDEGSSHGVREIHGLLPNEQFLHDTPIGNFRALFFEADSPRVVNVNLSWEQCPDSNWSLSLDEGTLDPFGQPRLRVHWGLDDSDVITVNAALEALRSSLPKLLPGRFERVLEHPIRQWPVSHGFVGVKPGDHPMGSLRMSEDAEHGVVDGDSRIHGLENAFVLGSATFPTGGISNPTLTCVALSLRLADQLANRLCERTAS